MSRSGREHRLTGATRYSEPMADSVPMPPSDEARPLGSNYMSREYGEYR